MASGTITNPNKLTSTDTTLKGITFYYTRIGQVVQCVIGDGATTSALANGQELGDRTLRPLRPPRPSVFMSATAVL